jgi:hypothetical protein
MGIKTGYFSFIAGFIGFIYLILAISKNDIDWLFILLWIATPFNFYCSFIELIKLNKSKVT